MLAVMRNGCRLVGEVRSSGMSTVEQRVSRLENQQDRFKADIADLKVAIAETRTDIQEAEERQVLALADLKKELKGDIAELKSAIKAGFAIMFEAWIVYMERLPKDHPRSIAFINKVETFAKSLDGEAPDAPRT